MAVDLKHPSTLLQSPVLPCRTEPSYPKVSDNVVSVHETRITQAQDY